MVEGISQRIVGLLIPVILAGLFATGVAAGRWGWLPGLNSGPADGGENDSVRVVSSTLLPLAVNVFGWDSPPPANPRGGGGIEVVGEEMLGVDRWGRFFTYRVGGHTRILPADIETGIDDLASLTVDVDQLREQGLDVADLQSRGFDPADPGPYNLRSFRFLDLAARAHGQGLSIAVSHYSWDPERACKSFRVSMAWVPDRPAFLAGEQSVEPDDWITTFEADPCFPFTYRNNSSFQSPNSGGAVLFTSEERLLLAVGDHHLDGVNNRQEAAQAPESPLGKLIEIDVVRRSYRILASGLRDPQGLIRDPEGRIWITDVGPEGGDELNHVDGPQPNFGWPRATFGTNYGSYQWPLSSDAGRHEGFDPPLLAWVPSINVTRLVHVGEKPLRWQADLLLASLNGELHRVRIQNGAALFAEPISIGTGIRDLVQLPDGTFVLWSADGGTFLEMREEAPGSDLLLPSGAPGSFASCLACHGVGNGPGPSAPTLAGVYGRRIASTGYTGYSAALRSTDGRWNRESLRDYLRAPQEFASGTTMPQPEIGSAAALDSILDFLRETR